MFNGTYTIESPKGGHRTFKVATVLRGKLEGRRVVSLLTGPDNESSWSGFGFVEESGIAVWGRRNRSVRGLVSTPQARAEWLTFTHREKLSTMLWSLSTEGEASQFYRLGYRLLLEGRCLICNRKLTTPESITSGVGPVCAGRSK